VVAALNVVYRNSGPTFNHVRGLRSSAKEKFAVNLADGTKLKQTQNHRVAALNGLLRTRLVENESNMARSLAFHWRGTLQLCD
jgi:hypothetical protein